MNTNIDTPDDGGGATPPPDGSNDDETRTEPAKPADPKPTETVAFWKDKARQNEARAKANADAARKLADIEDRDKSEQQRQADALAKAQQDARAAVADAIRYRAAAAHGIDADNFDLIPDGDEEAVMARAERIGQLLAQSRELTALREQQPARPVATGRPQPALRPGVTPVEPGLQPSAKDTVSALIEGRGWKLPTTE